MSRNDGSGRPRRKAGASTPLNGHDYRDASHTSHEPWGSLCRALGVPAVLSVLLLTGCDGAPSEPEVSDLGFAGEISLVSQDSIRARLTVTHAGFGDVELQFGGCLHVPTMVQMFAFDRVPEDNVDPVWTSFHIPDPDQPCFTPLRTRTLGTGESVTFERGFSTSDVLGDSLPGGEYYFRLAPRFHDPSIRADSARVDVQVPSGGSPLTIG